MHSQRIRQRRRRVTLDQIQQEEVRTGSPIEEEGALESSRRDETRPARPYTEGARRSRQFKTTDLIPKRFWSLIGVASLLLAAIAGLNLLHWQSPNWIEAIGEGGVAALSLESGRGIGVWYSNFLLLLTSCVSLQLYLLRRHRRDDYRGSYRIWLWLALIFLIASCTSVTGISELFRNLAGNLTGSGAPQNALVLILVIKLAGLLLLAIRGLIEVRFSRLAVTGLLLVVAAYATAAVLYEVPQVQSQASEYVHAALGNSLLIGCTALFLSLLGYARFVYLDANGLILERSGVESKGSMTQDSTVNRKVASKQSGKKKSNRENLQDDTEFASKRCKRKSGETADSASTTDQKKTDSESDARKKRVKKKQETANNESGSGRKKPGGSSRKSSSTTSRGKSSARNSDRSSQSEGDDFLLTVDDNEIADLSKSERRRLRKLKKRDERRAA